MVKTELFKIVDNVFFIFINLNDDKKYFLFIDNKILRLSNENNNKKRDLKEEQDLLYIKELAS